MGLCGRLRKVEWAWSGVVFGVDFCLVLFWVVKIIKGPDG